MVDEKSVVPGLVGMGEGRLYATPTLVSRQRIVTMLVGAIILAAVHLLLQLIWPFITGGVSAGAGLRPQLNLALYVANLFVLAAILLTGRPVGPFRIAALILGYAVIVWLLWSRILATPENALLLVLSAIVYGGLLGHSWLLGYLYLFLLAQRFLPAYLYSAFLLASLFYTTLPPVARAWYRGHERFMPLCHLAGMMFLLALLLPVVYFGTESSAQDIFARLREPEVLSAIGVSLKTSAIAAGIVLVFGVPLAYAMVRRSFPGHALVDTLIDLPIVLPPPIVGITLLYFLGQRAPVGQFIEQHVGLRFFDSQWGIIAAQVFVGSPYLIRASMVAFAAVDVRYENVARTLGAKPTAAFFRVTLPMSVRGVLIGTVLTWFRAMAEFSSLRILANRPRTLPILAYERFIEFRQSESHSVAVLVMLLCVSVIVGMWIIRAMPSLLGRAIGAANASR